MIYVRKNKRRKIKTNRKVNHGIDGTVGLRFKIFFLEISWGGGSNSKPGRDLCNAACNIISHSTRRVVATYTATVHCHTRYAI